MAKNKKKIKFCWACGNKLWGNHSKELIVDEHPRTLHKKCAKQIKDGDFIEIDDGYIPVWVFRAAD